MSSTPHSTARKPTPKHRESPRSSGIRYAVVGLGHIAQNAVLPGMAQAKDSTVAALVSDDPVKLKALSRKYCVPLVASYDDFDRLLFSGGIDAVYIALPNDMHYRYTLRALHAGIHVLVEKPMAVTQHQCQEMIEAASESETLLMVAYRLHFERTNLRAIALAEAHRLGELRFFTSTFSMQVAAGNIRTRATSEGGGPLYDLGVYCINAARGLFRAEPIEVTAFATRSEDTRFTATDETVTAVLRFPEGQLASFTASFGASATAAYDLVGTKGSLRMDPAYEYQVELKQWVTIAGRTSKTKQPVKDQFAAEISYFSRCIRDGRQPEPSGAEGLADVRVVEAIIESARMHRPVALPRLGLPIQRPEPRQVITYPAGAKPKPVRARIPHRNE